MFVVHVLGLVAVVSTSAAAVFHVRGNDSAPYSNTTTIATPSAVATTTLSSQSSQSSTATLTPPFPLTGTAISSEDGRAKPTEQGSSGSSPPKNQTSPTCTVNIPDASLDWWYAATYAFPVGTLTNAAPGFTPNGSSLTFIPNSETFDVSSAIFTDIAYTPSIVYDSVWDFNYTYLEEYTVKPSAAITSLVSRTAALPLPSGNVIPATDVRLYDIGFDNLEPASVAVTSAPNSTTAITSATPFIYFSAYEVESAVIVTSNDGLVTSSVSTETVSLPHAYAYPYWIKGIEDYASASGEVPSEFLEQIPQSACGAGSVQATVTVLVVVDLVYVNIPHANPFIVHVESTALGWGDDANTDPVVVAANTGKDEPMGPAGGSATATEDLKPATQQTDNPGPVHNAGSNPPEAPNAPEPTQQTVGTIGTAPVVIGPSSVVVVGSQTLRPGGPAITVGDTPVSLVPSATAIVIGGTTSNLPQVIAPEPQQAPSPPILTIGSTTLTANAATQFFIGPGQTLTPGGTATVGGTVVSLAPSASFIVIGGSTQVLPTAGPGATARPEIVIGGSTITANPVSPSNQNQPNGPNNPDSAPTFVISGQTLVPGQTITVDGTTVALGPSGSFVVVNGVTSAFANPADPQITPPPLTIGDGVFRPLPGSGTTYIIGSSTLTPGGVITVAGTTISLAPGATALVINGQTTLLQPDVQGPITNPPLLTIGSQTYTAAPGTGTTFIIDGQTLTPGGTIVVDGTTISLAPGATELVYGSSGRSTTTALFPATTTRSQPVTTTTGASAGATGSNDRPAATSSPGAAYSIRASTFESWILSVLVGFLGLVLG